MNTYDHATLRSGAGATARPAVQAPLHRAWSGRSGNRTC